MKTILKILTFIWLTFWLYGGILMFLETPIQIEKDKSFIKTEIKPSVDFIKKFNQNNGRLPNNREYYTWHRSFYKDYSSDLTQKVDSLIPGFGPNVYIRKLSDVVNNDHNKFKKADWNKDFAIGVWRGEWTEYYFSWTDSYDSNKYSWKDGYESLAFMIGIGVFPLLLWWLKGRRKKKSIV